MRNVEHGPFPFARWAAVVPFLAEQGDEGMDAGFRLYGVVDCFFERILAPADAAQDPILGSGECLRELEDFGDRFGNRVAVRLRSFLA